MNDEEIKATADRLQRVAWKLMDVINGKSRLEEGDPRRERYDVAIAHQLAIVRGRALELPPGNRVDEEPVDVTKFGRWGDERVVSLPADVLRSLLGEGFHTAFRKELDTPEAWPFWKLIQEMEPDEWSSVIDFVMSGFERYIVTVEEIRDGKPDE